MTERKGKPGWVPRIYVEVTPEDYQRYSDLIPHGARAKILSPLIASFLDLVEQNPEFALGAVLSGKLTAKHVIERGLKHGPHGPKAKSD